MTQAPSVRSFESQRPPLHFLVAVVDPGGGFRVLVTVGQGTQLPLVLSGVVGPQVVEGETVLCRDHLLLDGGHDAALPQRLEAAVGVGVVVPRWEHVQALDATLVAQGLESINQRIELGRDFDDLDDLAALLSAFRAAWRA